MKQIYFLLLAVFLIASCTPNKTTVASSSKDEFLSDSLFPYATIKSTTQIDFFDAKLNALDSLQKRKIIPEITEGLYMEKDFPYTSLFIAYFVAKQDSIGSITPYIIRAHCDDFGALILITVNKNKQPVGHLIIEREEFCGADSISECEHYKHSLLNKNEIITSNLLVVTSSQTHKIIYIDSVAFKSVINPNGSITTTKLDSVRLVK